MNSNKIITIGREFGSGGLQLSRMLAQKLDIKAYDKDLINLTSIKSGVHSNFFKNLEESNTYSLTSRSLVSDPSFIPANVLSNEHLFKLQSDTILQIAEKESCIFVGRCADYILRMKRNLLAIFVCADFEERVANVSKLLGIDKKEAIKQIAKADKKRAAYYNYYTDKKWGEAVSYDICINVSLLGLDKSSEIILEIFNSKFKR